MLIRTFDKMSPEKQQQHISAAERFIASLN
jgi:hypothetical protein